MLLAPRAVLKLDDLSQLPTRVGLFNH